MTQNIDDFIKGFSYSKDFLYTEAKDGYCHLKFNIDSGYVADIKLKDDFSEFQCVYTNESIDDSFDTYLMSIPERYRFNEMYFKMTLDLIIKEGNDNVKTEGK